MCFNNCLFLTFDETHPMVLGEKKDTRVDHGRNVNSAAANPDSQWEHWMSDLCTLQEDPPEARAAVAWS